MWKKVEFLGSGGYGEVYLAVAEESLFLSSPSIAAVKTAELEDSLSLQREAMFLKEFRGNPFIIQGYGEDISQEENGEYRYNLLMELASGGDLDNLIENYNDIMPEYLVAWYTYMLLKGLSDIHSKGFVHCDIKPGNILVFPSQQGLTQLKIADFGVSKHVEEKIYEFRGTWGYGAPESLQRRIQGTAADIWSLGCVVLQMMTGGYCDWKAENRFEAEVPDYLSESGKDFLKNCLQVEVNSRWTADMLLNHPFIQENVGRMGLLERTHELFPTHKEASIWMSSKGLFSSRSAAAMEQCATRCYELFPQGSDMLAC